MAYLDDISGEYATPKGYAACDEHPDEFAAYESSFPYKEKLKLPGQILIKADKNASQSAHCRQGVVFVQSSVYVVFLWSMKVYI